MGRRWVMRRALSTAFLAALAGSLVAGCGSTGVQTTGTPVPGLSAKTGSFDDVEIDQSAHRLYAADRTDSGVDVFDVSGPAAMFLKTITLPAPPNGLAVAPDLGRLFAGTAAGTVEVVDTVAGSVTGEVKTGASEVDLIDYGAGPQQLFAATGAGGSVLTIDARTSKVLSTAKVGKPLEQPRYDPADGMVYVSVPDLDALAQIDPATGTVKKTLKLGGCIPIGLAIKPVAQTAVLACRASVMAYDLKTGKSQTFDRVADGDVVHYYPSVDRFFVTSAHDGVPTVVGMFGGDPIGYVTSANVTGGGNAAAYDATNDLVYTTDPRRGHVGVMSLRLDGSRPVPFWQSVLTTVVPFVVLAAFVAPLWMFIGRSADPANRKRRVPRTAPTVALAAAAPENDHRPSPTG
jgi:DNA-binding beta-propeller fold protein YncE